MERIHSAKTHLVETITTPFLLVSNKQRRTRWIEERIHQRLGRGIITTERASILLDQANQPGMQRYIFDLAMFGVIEGVSPVLSFASVALNDASVNFGELALVSPGALRFYYTLGRSIQEAITDQSLEPFKRRLVPGAVITLAPAGIGTVSVPLEMKRHYPEMSGFLVADTLIKVANPLRKLGSVGNNLADRVHKFSGRLLGNQPAVQA